jgi:DNA-binding MarR family transcriptional regulator
MAVALLRRRLRRVGNDELTLPESAALSRLDRGGPATAAALAKAEQISPQSMGATIAALQHRGLVGRVPDPLDGRRIVISLSDAGTAMVRERRSVRDGQLAAAMRANFSADEIAALSAALPLLERLAESI